MKVRNGYVSNSSSSSFVIWGKNALNYILTIKDGLAIYTEEIAKRVFWEIEGYDNDDAKVGWISDDAWKLEFESGVICELSVPASIYNRSMKISEYKNSFINWFCENYKSERFFKIEASDHEGETKYLEEDMMEKIREYNGPHIVINNH